MPIDERDKIAGKLEHSRVDMLKSSHFAYVAWRANTIACTTRARTRRLCTPSRRCIRANHNPCASTSKSMTACACACASTLFCEHVPNRALHRTRARNIDLDHECEHHANLHIQMQQINSQIVNCFTHIRNMPGRHQIL